VDFSGAVGGPFVVQWAAEPTEVMAEEPQTLTLRVTGPGNLKDMPRPALGKLEGFKPFAVEDLDDRFVPGDPPRREFRYRIRPRTAGVPEIPRFKFVYFNPRIVPPSRGYQTTYADPVPLTVKPRTAPQTVPEEVPAWMLAEPSWADVFEAESPLVERWVRPLLERLGMASILSGHYRQAAWPIAAVLLLVPPSICGLWYLIWRRVNPDTARLAAIHRSRAAAAAIRLLHSRTDDPARQAAAALTAYLQARAGLPPAATTPAEVAESLRQSRCSEQLMAAASDTLRRCDEARFAPAAVAGQPLAADAERVILAWEAETWSPPGS
jgi:hypothetical protein